MIKDRQVKYLNGKLFFLILLLCQHLSLKAQQPLNLNFEKASIEGYHRPWGWDIDSYGENTEISLDSIQKHGGKFSLHIASRKKGIVTDTPSISYLVEPYSLKGKKIRIEAWVRTEKLDGHALLVTGYSIPSKKGETIKMDTARVTMADADWRKISISMQVPVANISPFAIRLMSTGAGDIWYDDISLFVDDKKMIEAEVAPPFTNDQINWIEKNTTAFQSVDALPANQPAPDADLEFFKKACGNASLIAVGESTHGTSEFFRLKNRLLEYAVKQMGVRIFAMEDNAVIVERVNNYIHGGTGSARASMYGMFSVWQTEEVHAMIQWLREYNDQHPGEMVEFVGFDLQHLGRAADSLFAFLNRKDRVLKDTVSAWISGLTKNESEHYMATDSMKNSWYQVTEKMFQFIVNRKKEWLLKAIDQKDSREVEQGIQYANLVREYAHNLYSGHLSLYRDVAMAENISWILSMHKPGTRILIWAHDNHVSRGDHPLKDYNIYNGISMGSHLSKKYGSDYKCFSLSSYTGLYWAQISYTNFKQVECPLLPGPLGSLDEALHRVAQSRKNEFLFLDLHKAREQKWLEKPIPVRFANHVNIEYGYWTRFSMPYQFDGIFFMDTTHAARSYAR